jgi:hypothetical protein
MLKSSPIFRTNGVHLVEKKKDYALLRFECFEHAKTFLICVKFWTYKLCNQWKLFPKNICQFKLLCFYCDFSNIQNCSFTKCPLTWVTFLTMFLLKKVWMLIVFAHLHHNLFLFQSFENGRLCLLTGHDHNLQLVFCNLANKCGSNV